MLRIAARMRRIVRGTGTQPTTPKPFLCGTASGRHSARGSLFRLIRAAIRLMRMPYDGVASHFD